MTVSQSVSQSVSRDSMYIHAMLACICGDTSSDLVCSGVVIGRLDVRCHEIQCDRGISDISCICCCHDRVQSSIVDHLNCSDTAGVVLNDKY